MGSSAASQPGRALPVSLDALPANIAALYSPGSYSQVADALQAAIVQHPKDACLYYWVGRSYFEIRDFNRSISSWERAVALDPGRSEYHDWLGRAYGQKADESSHSNMDAALSLARRTLHEFETAVRLNAKNVTGQRDLIAFMANAPGNLGGGFTILGGANNQKTSFLIDEEHQPFFARRSSEAWNFVHA
jgi:tetratricopeptide (TPR) repeat protein